MPDDAVEIVVVIGEDGNLEDVLSVGRPVQVHQLDFGTGQEKPFEATWDASLTLGESLDHLIARLKEDHA